MSWAAATPAGTAEPAGGAAARRAGGRRGPAFGALALVGVAGSALALAALWPSAGRERAPVRLSAADAAAARAVVTRAQALVDVTPAQVGYRLKVAGPLEGMRGRIDTGARTITLFVAPTAAPHRIAHDLAHEIGHAFDTGRLSAGERAAHLRARGASGASWWPDGATSDYATGAGDFAEVFALCHAASPDYRSRLAVRPQDPCRLLPNDARTANLGGGGT
jgi:hypothetical protein